MMVAENSQKSRLVEKLLLKLVEYGKTQPDIVAILNQGSRARSDHPADEWADLDLIIFSTNKPKYLDNSDWLENLGKPIVTHLEKTAVGDELERRAIFEGGVDVDFSIISKEQLGENVEHPSRQDLDMIRRGVRVLFDRTGTVQANLSKLSKTTPPVRSPPSRKEFDQVVNDFLYHIYWTAKKLRRGELWVAKVCCDGYMKRQLLTMIEWSTLSSRGWKTDVWYGGRYLEEWIEPETRKALRGTFAHYDYADVEKSLFATSDLFLKLSRDTGQRMGYDKVALQAGTVIELARSCLLESKPSGS
jgi:aminoglycoside 6-adenylyltransferase